MYVFGIFDKRLGYGGCAVFLGEEDISRWLRPLEAEEIMVAQFCRGVLVCLDLLRYDQQRAWGSTLTIAGWPSAPWYLGCMRPGSSATLRISCRRDVVANERRRSKCLRAGIRDINAKDRLLVEEEGDV